MMLVRSALFNLFFYVSTFIMTLPAVALTRGHTDRALRFARLWARLQIHAVRIICGIRLEVTGQENLPPGAVLIASRHESTFDILAWIVLVPAACFVVKLELTRVPLFGRMIEMAGMISIDREAGGTAMRVLLRGGDRAKAEGRQIIIFPEGTRADPGDNPPLQPGIAALAARTGLPIVPVVTDSGRCWSRRAFRKRSGTIHIRIQPPLSGTDGREATMAALRTAFAQYAAVDKSGEESRVDGIRSNSCRSNPP